MRKGQTTVEFLLLLSAVLVAVAAVLACFVTSSSSMSSSVSGEIENTKQDALDLLKSNLSGLPPATDFTISFRLLGRF